MGTIINHTTVRTRLRPFWLRTSRSSAFCYGVWVGLRSRNFYPTPTGREGCVFHCRPRGHQRLISTFVRVLDAGVLTLFGLLTLTQPVWLKALKSEKIPTFHLAAIVSFSTILLVPELQSQSVWASRIGTPSIQQWFEHALLTGTYPLFPWFMYAIFGAWMRSVTSSQGCFQPAKRLCQCW